MNVGTWWPLLLLVASCVVLGIAWLRQRGVLFPDINLLKHTAYAGGVADRLPLQLGVLVIVLLTLSLMDITATRLVELWRTNVIRLTPA